MTGENINANHQGTIFYSIDAGDWGIIDEFPYEQIFSQWWYFQSAESRGHLEGVNPGPGSNVKCLSRDRRWPRLVAGPNIIIQFRTRYQFHFGDQKTIRSDNCLQTVRGTKYIIWWPWPAGPGDVVTHLHRGRAPEQREDERRAPGRRGEAQAPQVPALTADIGPVLERSSLWTVELSSLI